MLASIAEINKIQRKYWDIAALACLLACVCFFVWKAPYGFGLDDESWYLTFPHRLFLGDSLLTDEWHVAQLIGFLLYLPAKVYLAVSGTTDGIILYFRYLFIAMQSSVAALIYIKLRSHGFAGIAAAMIFFLHIPVTIMALGYYSMGIAFIVAAGVLMATANPGGKAVYFAIGVIFACAALCNPILVFVFILYLICMLVFEIGKKNGRRFFKFSETSFCVRTWLLITAGAFAVFALFVIYLFVTTNLKQLAENFPMLFTDPEYQVSGAGGTSQNLIDLKDTLLEIIKINPYLIAVFTIITLVAAFDRKRFLRRRWYLIAGAVAAGAFIIDLTITVDFPYFGYWMLPLAWLGLLCYMLSERKNQKHFIFLWLFGLLYALCLDITSYMGFIVASQGLTLSSIASSLFIKTVIEEVMEQNKRSKHAYKKKTTADKRNAATAAVAAVMLFTVLPLQIVMEVYMAADLKLSPEYIVYDETKDYSFARASIDRTNKERLDTLLLAGPEKGIKTTAARAAIYNGIIGDLDKIKEKGAKPALVAANMPWCHLYLDMPYATHSTWFLAYLFEEQKSRLLEYYALHPDKSPGYIYIPKYVDLLYIYYPKRAETMLAGFDEVFNFTLTESQYGYILEII